MSRSTGLATGENDTVDTGLGDGVLNVNKAAGWTSHDVVAKLRRLLGCSRIGHAGTLDPAATGVLPILTGRATRIAEFLLDWDKEYWAVLRLGETTDTQDATGTVLARRPTDGLDEAAIRAAVARFQGRISQVPPMYSAVKVGGVPLYKAARAGRIVARGAREVTVHEIAVQAVHGRDVSLRVVCSKGTYVRTLCADIGAALGVGGHLLTLQRSRVGPLTIERALSLEEVGARASAGRLAEDLLSLDAALGALPALEIEAAAARRARHGVPIPAQAVTRLAAGASEGLRGGQPVRLKDPAGGLLGIGLVPEGGLIPGGAAPGPSARGDRVVPVLKVLAPA
ncbi:tRNA pseudouridine(55) synthase TruB [Nitrospira sp. Kam-Ns4a]